MAAGGVSGGVSGMDDNINSVHVSRRGSITIKHGGMNMGVGDRPPPPHELTQSVSTHREQRDYAQEHLHDDPVISSATNLFDLAAE